MVVRSSAARQGLAAILLVALTLAGVGRALATADMRLGRLDILAGVAVPICHAGAGEPAAPDGPRPHDCCDACALLAPVALPGPASCAVPARIASFAPPVAASSRAPLVARIPTPRLSQGPPGA